MMYHKMIFVDDEPWALTGLSTIIDWKDHGFTLCSCCEDAEEALDAIQTHKPDVVFTDIRMPDMSGIDLISTVRSMGLECDFVITSAYSDFEVAKEAIRYGAYHYLLKPLDHQEVLDVALRLDAKYAETRAAAVPDLTQPLAEGVKERIQEIASYPNCYVGVLDSDNFPATGPEVKLMPVRFSTSNAYGCLISARSEDPPRLGESLFLSRRYPNFAKLEEMRQDADIARAGCFCYARHETIAAVQRYIGAYYRSEIRLKELAGQFYLSEAYLCDLFRKHTDRTINSFLKDVRLGRAKRLLQRSDNSLRDVAAAVGYEDYSYFGRVFKKETGLTPEEYRRSARSPAAP